MTTFLSAMIDSSFHATEDGHILFRLGGLWGQDTFIIASEPHAASLRRRLFFWYGAALLFIFLLTAIPFILPDAHLWQLVVFVLTMPALALSLRLRPRNLTKSALIVTGDQLVESFLKAVTIPQILARISVSLPIAAFPKVYSWQFDPREELTYALFWLGLVATIFTAFFVACIIAKLAWPTVVQSGEPQR